MAYMESRHTAPFGAITLYRAGSALTSLGVALSRLIEPRRPALSRLSPAELEDIGLSVTDLTGRRRGLLGDLAETFRAWSARRQTVAALSRLSDAQLEDIGLTRWHVEELRAGRIGS